MGEDNRQWGDALEQLDGDVLARGGAVLDDQDRSREPRRQTGRDRADRLGAAERADAEHEVER
jgi:hypothetical protein